MSLFILKNEVVCNKFSCCIQTLSFEKITIKPECFFARMLIKI